MPHALRNANANRLLASLPPGDAALLGSFSRVEHLTRGRILITASQPVTEMWFPQTGTVALVTTDAAGRTVQTAMVGRAGCIGFEALFGDSRAVSDGVVQISGAMLMIPVSHFQGVFEASPRVQLAISKFLYSLAAQSLQTIACNRLHSLLQRCCRWLLTMHDLTTGDDLAVTQENLATLLGGGRPRVNLLLARLQTEGILQRHRGHIHLSSRTGLEQHACECYRLMRDGTGSVRPGRASKPSATARPAI
jgi:CRP-like cAMP-binding protein